MKKRILLLCGIGLALIAVILFWPTAPAEVNPGEDPPCMASRFGLPCRP